MKKNRIFCLFPFFTTLLLLLAGCLSSEAPTQKLQARVGEEIYANLRRPGHVQIERRRSMTQPEIEKVQAFLLDDEAYIFERTKKCLFVPEITLIFEGKEGRAAADISFVCKQVRFRSNSHAVVLDIDPVAQRLHDYVQEELVQ